MTLKADYSHSANPEIVKLDPALLESSISQALLQVLNSRLHAELFSPGTLTASENVTHRKHTWERDCLREVKLKSQGTAVCLLTWYGNL